MSSIIQSRITFSNKDKIDNITYPGEKLKVRVNIETIDNNTVTITITGVDYYGNKYIKKTVLKLRYDNDYMYLETADSSLLKTSEDSFFTVARYEDNSKLSIVDVSGIYLLFDCDITEQNIEEDLSPTNVVFPIVSNKRATEMTSHGKLTDSDYFSFSINDNNLYIYYNTDNLYSRFDKSSIPIKSFNGVIANSGAWSFVYNLNFIESEDVKGLKGRVFKTINRIENVSNTYPKYNYKQIPEGMTGLENRRIVVDNYDFTSSDMDVKMSPIILEALNGTTDPTTGDTCDTNLSFNTTLDNHALITYWPAADSLAALLNKYKWDDVITNYYQDTRLGKISYNDLGIMEFIITNDITYDTYYSMYIDTRGDGESDITDGECVAVPSVLIEMSTTEGVSLNGHWLAKGGTVNGGKIWIRCGGDNTYKIFPSAPNSPIYAIAQSVVADGKEVESALFYINVVDGNLAGSSLNRKGLIALPSEWTVTAISDLSACICSNNLTYGGLYIDDKDSDGATADGRDKSLYYIKYTDPSLALHWQEFDIETEEGKNYKVSLPVITDGDEIVASMKYDPETYDTLCAFDICTGGGGDCPEGEPPCPSVEGKSEAELELCHNCETYIDANGCRAKRWVYDEAAVGNGICEPPPPPPPGECECEEGQEMKYILNPDGTYRCICINPTPPPIESSSISVSSPAIYSPSIGPGPNPSPSPSSEPSSSSEHVSSTSSDGQSSYSSEDSPDPLECYYNPVKSGYVGIAINVESSNFGYVNQAWNHEYCIEGNVQVELKFTKTIDRYMDDDGKIIENYEQTLYCTCWCKGSQYGTGVDLADTCYYITLYSINLAEEYSDFFDFTTGMGVTLTLDRIKILNVPHINMTLHRTGKSGNYEGYNTYYECEAPLWLKPNCATTYAHNARYQLWVKPDAHTWYATSLSVYLWGSSVANYKSTTTKKILKPTDDDKNNEWQEYPCKDAPALLECYATATCYSDYERKYYKAKYADYKANWYEAYYTTYHAIKKGADGNEYEVDVFPCEYQGYANSTFTRDNAYEYREHYNPDVTGFTFDLSKKPDN